MYGHVHACMYSTHRWPINSLPILPCRACRANQVNQLPTRTRGVQIILEFDSLCKVKNLVYLLG